MVFLANKPVGSFCYWGFFSGAMNTFWNWWGWWYSLVSILENHLMCFNIFNVVTSFSGFIALCGLPLVAANGGCSLAEVPGLLTAVVSLVGAHAPGRVVSVVWRALGHSPVVWHSGAWGLPRPESRPGPLHCAARWVQHGGLCGTWLTPRWKVITHPSPPDS